MSANGTMTRVEKAIAAKRNRGFKLHCPVCGEQTTITLDLSDLATCSCESCGDSFAVGTAIKLFSERVAQWERLAQWIDLAADVQAAPSTESE
jgi:transcription elongation factor Elf1